MLTEVRGGEVLANEYQSGPFYVSGTVLETQNCHILETENTILSNDIPDDMAAAYSFKVALKFLTKCRHFVDVKELIHRQ